MIIKNNDERLIFIGKIGLLPGCNMVDKKEWDELTKKRKVTGNDGVERVAAEFEVKDYFDSKRLEIISTKKGEKTLFDIKDFPVNKRKALLEETYNIDTLQQWVQQEEDTSLRYLIEKRIEKIKKNEISDSKKYGKPNNHV